MFCFAFTDQPIVPQSFGTQPTSAQQLPALIAALPLEVSSGFSQVLAALTGSKVPFLKEPSPFIRCLRTHSLHGTHIKYPADSQHQSTDGDVYLIHG